ncbi:MAG TPA: oligosaccharide flippase family protein [Stenomitos sp.]
MKSSSLPPPTSLSQNFSWTLIGNLVYSACQWGMLIILAKLGTPEMVGEFTFALATAAPLFMFTNLQLRVVQATDSNTQYLFCDYLSLRLVASLAAVLGLVCIAFSMFVPSRELAYLIICIGLAKAVESISDVCYGLVQQHERMDIISISLIFKGLLSLLFLASGVHIFGTVLGGTIGLILAWLILLLVYDLPKTYGFIKRSETPFARTLWLRWHWPTQLKLIGLTLPLGFVMLLVSLNTNIPRYFIEHYLSPRDLGIFAAIAYLMMVGSIIQGAMAQAATPRLAKYYADGQRKAFAMLLSKQIGMAMLLGLAAVIISAIAGKQILTIIYKPEYAQYSQLLVMLMLAAALEYICSFLGSGITAARYFRSQVPLFATTACILAIACMVFIPMSGLNGIPWAMILTGLIRIFLFVGILIHALRKPNPIEHNKPSII